MIIHEHHLQMALLEHELSTWLLLLTALSLCNQTASNWSISIYTRVGRFTGFSVLKSEQNLNTCFISEKNHAFLSIPPISLNTFSKKKKKIFDQPSFYVNSCGFSSTFSVENLLVHTGTVLEIHFRTCIIIPSWLAFAV